jgi:hypothetical protein
MAKNDDTNEQTKQLLAQAIRKMSYGELLKIGDQMANIKHQRLETAADFAKLLHDWAEGQ